MRMRKRGRLPGVAGARGPNSQQGGGSVHPSSFGRTFGRLALGTSYFVFQDLLVLVLDPAQAYHLQFVDCFRAVGTCEQECAGRFVVARTTPLGLGAHRPAGRSQSQ
jgi:hypothetical protein